MTYSELKRKLRKAGCRLEQEGSRHEIWYSPTTGKRFTVGRHDQQEVAAGTLRSILRDAGLH